MITQTRANSSFEILRREKMLTEFQVEMLIIVCKALAIAAYLYCGERWCELNY